MSGNEKDGGGSSAMPSSEFSVVTTSLTFVSHNDLMFFGSDATLREDCESRGWYTSGDLAHGVDLGGGVIDLEGVGR